jgi:hypothetical protein
MNECDCNLDANGKQGDCFCPETTEEKSLEAQLTEAKEEVEKVLDEMAIANAMTIHERQRAEEAERDLLMQKDMNKQKSRLLKEERQENKRLREVLSSLEPTVAEIHNTAIDIGIAHGKGFESAKAVRLNEEHFISFRLTVEQALKKEVE